MREEDCKLQSRSHYHLQQNPAILPVEQSKASSCSLVPYPLCSASALKKCANFGVCPWKGCCCYEELECADFDPSPHSIPYFLLFFWVMIVWLGSLLACSLFAYAEAKWHQRQRNKNDHDGPFTRKLFAKLPISNRRKRTAICLKYCY